MEPAVSRPPHNHATCPFRTDEFKQKEVNITYLIDDGEQRKVRAVPIEGGLSFGKSNWEAAKAWRMMIHNMETHETYSIRLAKLYDVEE